jgi:hypothetical protein
MRRPWFFVCAGLVASPILAVESMAQTILKSVMPRFETPPLFDDEAGGNADGDDPAIWVHPQHPPLSPVIATPPAPSPGDAPQPLQQRRHPLRLPARGPNR